MKIYPLIALLLLTGCKAQLVTVSSDNVTGTPTYIYEDDTVRITYNFWKLKGQISFDIYNKLDIPIYVDWKNTVHISNGISNPYWNDVTVSRGVSLHRPDYFVPGVNSYSTAVTSRDARVTSIAPRSYAARRDYLITDGKPLPNGAFSPARSPLQFREYFHFYTSEDLQNGRHLVDNSFYVSSVVVKRQNKILDRRYIRPDQFFILPN